ncbi:hypothetical protein [Vibrio vulnificus]|uniref:hypothetical protein n=1 Tax=Vibrio vulnificus TaxID=672 RepID=UPI00102903EC|nr:hypothetical protein [Vibrio vulnificus]RZP89603.1 hypothetical protein D8T54_19685 [Vibrio vulnificus]RZR41905.1 hypothetical protein D8T58_20170 [Vibrio vulnificus]
MNTKHTLIYLGVIDMSQEVFNPETENKERQPNYLLNDITVVSFDLAQSDLSSVREIKLNATRSPSMSTHYPLCLSLFEEAGARHFIDHAAASEEDAICHLDSWMKQIEAGKLWCVADVLNGKYENSFSRFADSAQAFLFLLKNPALCAHLEQAKLVRSQPHYRGTCAPALVAVQHAANLAGTLDAVYLLSLEGKGE